MTSSTNGWRTMKSGLLSAWLLSGCAGLPSPPAGPQPTPPEDPGAGFFEGVPQAAVMMLGTFHFQDAGLDSYRPEHHVDVQSAERQREVEELTRLLAEFRPTKIAVEQGPSVQARLDSLYGDYRAGRWELRSNEIFQIGFRLAALLGHDRVWAVDAERHPFTLQLWRDHREELLAAERADAELAGRYRALYSHDDALKMRLTLREYLVRLNDPERLLLSHGHNMIATFKAEGESGFVGPDASLGWYSRNLRIFRNIQRITDSSDERILVIMGSGHLPTLQFYAAASPEFDLVDVRDYLEPRTGNLLRFR
jgi:hypothetical protein